ncbi:cutinase-domain-containing protein [Acephala macrosclerotiorum]|nr:cutinase-domain-containing protein [Acephala macrosclerotiorum]
MKFQSLAIAAIICAVTATSVPNTQELDAPRLEARQSATSDELINGTCKAVTFIFARGSTESDNMGTITTLGADQVACQGVGSPYDATLADNSLPQNTSPTDIGAVTTMFNLANSKCPNTKVVAGGYSQGTAVMGGSIQALPTKVFCATGDLVCNGTLITTAAHLTYGVDVPAAASFLVSTLG